MADFVEFQYRTVQNARGEVLSRPLLPFTLTHAQSSVQVLGLIDTGSDINVLPYRVGLSLGLVWEQHPMLEGLSGNLSVHEARGVVIYGQVQNLRPARLVFGWSRADNIPVLLGQLNFLNEFDVCFFGAQSTFEIRRRSTS